MLASKSFNATIEEGHTMSNCPRKILIKTERWTMILIRGRESDEEQEEENREQDPGEYEAECMHW